MYCPGCFKIESKRGMCPVCGYDSALKRSPLLLPHHSLIGSGRYIVGRLVGKLGGFGATYLAYDTRLLTVVAIKEYLPRDIATRDASTSRVRPHGKNELDVFRYGLARFIDEARILAKIDHPNVIRVRDYLEDNSTAYLVMDYCDGLTLSDYTKRQPTGRIEENIATAIILPILDGLASVHRLGYLHRDVKPQNIYLSIGNKPILLDFGAARQLYSGKTRSMTIIVSEGYAPIEQYQQSGYQGPWTDVYGASATLYTMLTGKSPPNATDRITSKTALPGLHGISKSLRSIIEDGMAISYSQRVQDIPELRLRIARQPYDTTHRNSAESLYINDDLPKEHESLSLRLHPIFVYLKLIAESSYLIPLIISLMIIALARIWTR
jgi:serine/threonine protein kinase